MIFDFRVPYVSFWTQWKISMSLQVAEINCRIDYHHAWTNTEITQQYQHYNIVPCRYNNFEALTYWGYKTYWGCDILRLRNITYCKASTFGGFNILRLWYIEASVYWGFGILIKASTFGGFNMLRLRYIEAVTYCGLAILKIRHIEASTCRGLAILRLRHIEA